MNSKQPIRLEEIDAGHPLRQHPFEAVGAGVPDGYFDTLASRVQARVAHQTQSAGPIISWSWGRTMASMAGAGLVATLVWITWPQRQDSIGRETLSGVSDAAIVAYLDEQGLNPDEVTALQTSTAATSDEESSSLQYLDIKSDAIRQHLESQDISDELTDMGS
ncbi:hypothetical protein [Fibrivirga algicola]|uniref:Anti sigma-E protein RseA N-terminal domain-containing protein n=1 Tax=Fibrivirga algicola TaxID=2950420 RepID=A0ABX0QCF9_9BACT|nr:hypothetical protein [Fibrivirga algicola]NID08612.1 hypothetical protein [Fibrivirga algicola]